MKVNIRLLLICIAIPLIAGGISGFIAKDSTIIYQQLDKPAISPSGEVFPIVWTVLYVLMGVASYLILTSGKNASMISHAMRVYLIQLAVNILWPIFFFNLQWYFFAFVWLAHLWFLILFTMLLFYRISKPAAYLMLPYLLWVTFAGYLNLSIYLLN